MANIFSSYLICSLIISYCICLMLSTPVQARSHYPETMELRLCGKKLVQWLQKVCNHRYNRPTEDNLNNKFFQRAKRGIAHDCCKSKCTVGYIKKYCEL